MWIYDPLFVLLVVVAGDKSSGYKPTVLGLQARPISPYRGPDSTLGFRVIERRNVITDHRVSVGALLPSGGLTLGSDMSKLWRFLKFEKEAQSTAWEEYPATK